MCFVCVNAGVTYCGVALFGLFDCACFMCLRVLRVKHCVMLSGLFHVRVFVCVCVNLFVWWVYDVWCAVACFVFPCWFVCVRAGLKGVCFVCEIVCDVVCVSVLA